MTEGQKLLDDIYNFGTRFVVFPNERSKIAWTCGVVHCHLIDAFYTTPRLLITAATKGCGKTTLADITELLTPRSMGLINPSPSSLFRLIEKKHPTLIVDEVQELFNKKEIHDITMIVNSGFQRGKKVTRAEQVGKEWKVKEYEVFGPLILVGIDKGNIPDTILDRCIPIRLKKRVTSERVEQYDMHTTPREGHALRGRIEAWTQAVLGEAKAMGRPKCPNEIEGRNRNKWEPLFAVTDLAGGTSGTVRTDGTGGMWSDRVRRAALEYLSEEREDDRLDHGQLALVHISQIFEDVRGDKVSSYDLTTMLHEIKDAPWPEYKHGKPLSQQGLAELLRPYEIKPEPIYFEKDGEKERMRGYYKADFKEAFERFIPSIPAVPVVSADLPPLKWSSLKYVFRTEDKIDGKEEAYG